MSNEDIRAEVRAELNLAVDENNLLEEWKNQAAMMLDYGIKLADAMQEADEAKAKLAIVVAELDQDIRMNPTDYGYVKATETIVPNAIPGTPEHQVALRAFNKARHRTRVLQAAVDALDGRKRTLQGMTDLFLRQWFADPRSRGTTEDLEAATGTAPTKKISGRRTRRPRQ